MPEDQIKVFQQADSLMNELRRLPEKPGQLRLGACGSAPWQFNWDHGKITAFDFDDIGYNWFVNDISILLYNVLWYPVVPYDDKAAFTEEFMTHFMKGYWEEMSLTLHG